MCQINKWRRGALFCWAGLRGAGPLAEPYRRSAGASALTHTAACCLSARVPGLGALFQECFNTHKAAVLFFTDSTLNEPSQVTLCHSSLEPALLVFAKRTGIAEVDCTTFAWDVGGGASGATHGHAPHARAQGPKRMHSQVVRCGWVVGSRPTRPTTAWHNHDVCKDTRPCDCLAGNHQAS